MQVKIFIALSVGIVTSVFGVSGYFLCGLFGEVHVSSFLGVIIGVNTSIIFRRVRQWMFKFFYHKVCTRISRLHNILKGLISDSEIDAVYNFAAMSFAHFKTRLDKLTTFSVTVCFIVAIAVAALFWTGIPNEPKWIVRFLHLLLLPPILYFTAMVVCCLCMIDHCNEHFGEYETHAAKTSAKGIGGIDDLKVEVKFKNALERLEKVSEPCEIVSNDKSGSDIKLDAAEK